MIATAGRAGQKQYPALSVAYVMLVMLACGCTGLLPHLAGNSLRWL